MVKHLFMVILMSIHEPIHAIKPKTIVSRSQFAIKFASFASSYAKNYLHYIDDYVIDDFVIACRSIAATLNLNLYDLELPDIRMHINEMNMANERPEDLVIGVHQAIQAYRYCLRDQIIKYERNSS